jgi:hypothetical protein
VAFPTVQDADTKSGVVTSNSSSWTLTYPTNLADGDLVYAFVATDGAPSFSFPAFFTHSGATGPSAVKLGRAWARSDGTQSGNFTLTLGAAEQGGWRVFRITGIFADSDLGNVVADATTETGSPSSTPDPPSLNPSTWDVEDTLWIAACAVDTSRTITLFPTLYTNTSSDVSGGAGGATLGLCRREQGLLASEDPGSFTISNSDDWAAATIAIRPAAGVPAAAVPRHAAVNHQDPGLLMRRWQQDIRSRLWLPRYGGRVPVLNPAVG